MRIAAGIGNWFSRRTEAARRLWGARRLSRIRPWLAIRVLAPVLCAAIVCFALWQAGNSFFSGKTAALLKYLPTPLAVLFFGLKWWRSRQPPVVLPFRNLTGDTRYDAPAMGFSELVQLEIHRIFRLIREGPLPEQETRRNPASRREDTPQIAVVPARDSLAGISSSLSLGGDLDRIGALGLGPVSVPLGGVLSLILRGFHNKVVSGSFQMNGPVLCVIARYGGQTSRCWEVRAEASENEGEAATVRDLATLLAHRIVWETSGTTASDWTSFRELVDGLHSYRDYLLGGASDAASLEKARHRFERAIRRDSKFALAYYYLARICDEQALLETAIEMYQLAVQLQPDLWQAHLRLGQDYRKADRIDDAIRECRRAVELAASSGQEVPQGRSLLGRCLMAAPQYAEHDSLEDALDCYSQAILQFRGAIREYGRQLRRESRRPYGTAETERAIQDALAETWQDLAGAYWGLREVRRLAGQEAADRGAQHTEHALQEMLRLQPESLQAHAELFRYYYFARQDYPRAAHHLDQLQRIDPKSVDAAKAVCELISNITGDDLISLAQEPGGQPDRQPRQERLDNAEKALQVAAQKVETALASEPRDPDLWIRLAGLYALRAEVCRQDAGRREATFPNLDCALALLGKALALDPDNRDVFQQLANVTEAKANERRGAPGQIARSSQIRKPAKSSYRRAPTAPPSPGVPDSGGDAVVQLYRALGDTDWREVEANIQGSEPGPESRVFWWALGWSAVRRGRNEEGLGYLEKALGLPGGDFPEAWLVRHDLAGLYHEQRRWDKAVEMLEAAEQLPECLSQVSQPVQRILDLAEAYSDSGNYGKAEETYTKVVDHPAADVFRVAQALACRAEACRLLKRPADAIRDCEKAARLAPLYAFPFLVLTQVYQDLKDFEQAMHACHLAELAPEAQGICHRRLGELYREQAAAAGKERDVLLQKSMHHYKAALGFSEAAETDDRALIHSELASILTELKCYEEAGIEYECAIVLAGDSPDTHAYHSRLGDVFVQRKKFGAAEQEYKKAAELCEAGLRKAGDPQQERYFRAALAFAYNQLAYFVHAEQEADLPEGLRLVERALELAQGEDADTKGAFLDTRAWIYYKLGDHEKAISDLEDVIKLTKGTLDERHHLALAHERKAECCRTEEEIRSSILRARREWEHVLDMDPEGELGRHARKRLADLDSQSLGSNRPAEAAKTTALGSR